MIELSMFDAVGSDPRGIYRQALKRSHPDAGGDSADFIAVREAGRALGLTN